MYNLVEHMIVGTGKWVLPTRYIQAYNASSGQASVPLRASTAQINCDNYMLAHMIFIRYV